MDNWGVFLAIGELIAFFVLVAKPLINLTTTLTKLNVTVENLSQMLAEQKERSKKTHERLWKHNEEQDEKIEDHETRILLIEQKDVNKKIADEK